MRNHWGLSKFLVLIHTVHDCTNHRKSLIVQEDDLYSILKGANWMRDSAVYLEITIQIDIWFVCGFLKEKEKRNLSWKWNWNVPPKAEVDHVIVLCDRTKTWHYEGFNVKKIIPFCLSSFAWLGNLSALWSHSRPHKKCSVINLGMPMESWTLSLIRQCQNRVTIQHNTVKKTKTPSLTESLKRREQYLPRVLGKNVLFCCNNICFPESKCDCK